MIHVEQHGPVLAIRMARSFFGRPLYWTAAYWVDGLLIDTGPRCTAKELARALTDVPVEQIALTHGHEDHTGGLSELRQHAPHAPIYACRRTIPLVEDPTRINMQRYRRLIWGRPRSVRGVSSFDEVDDLIQTPNYRFKIVETPGHSVDHVALFEPEQRWLFCGDAFIGGRDQSWTPEPDMFGVICSLRALATLKPQRLFPGSGRVRRTPLPDIHEKIGYLISLSREVAELEAAGQSTAEIAASLFEQEGRMSLWTGGHFSSENLVEACRSYNALFASTVADRSRGTHADRFQSDADSTDASDSSTSRSSGAGDTVR